MKKNINNLCPVCGYDFDNFKWQDSQEICPQCDIQFGYEDCAGGDSEYQQRIYKVWRIEWQKNGSQKNWKPTNETIKNIIKKAKTFQK